MPYVFFHEYFPEVASLETRSITIMLSANEFGLPASEYTFIEQFCDECDCKRVMFYVVQNQSQNPVAVINWGWGSKQFYEKWLGFKNDILVNEMMGAELNSMSIQSPIANNILGLFKNILLKDKNYLARVQKHYELTRSKINKNKRNK